MNSDKTVNTGRKFLRKYARESALVLGGVAAFGICATSFFAPNTFDSMVYGISSQRAPQTPDVGANRLDNRTHSYNSDLDGDGFDEAINCLHFDDRVEQRLIEYDRGGKIQFIPFRLEDGKIIRLPE